MKFLQSKGSVHCIRQYAVGGELCENLITSFDERLDTVAPHVSGLLTGSELEELHQWLEERAKLRHRLDEQTTPEAAIDTLPNLLNQMTQSVSDAKRIDAEKLSAILRELEVLQTKLQNLSIVRSQSDPGYDILDASEVLDEQLRRLQSHTES